MSLKITGLFFDRPKVIRAMDAATRKALSKVGAFVRTRARSSLRKGRQSAAPGNPPKVHAGQLRSLLFFSYEPDRQTVVIGPARFKDGGVPGLLEFGGAVVRRDRRTGASRTLHYSAFPYMGPALNKEIAAGTIPAAWRNSVKGN